MDKHISFGELVAFAWMDELTPEMRDLALKVNRHLIRCEGCQRRLEQMEQIRREAEELRDQQRKREEAKRRMDANSGRVLPFLGREIQAVKRREADQNRPGAEKGEPEGGENP